MKTFTRYVALGDSTTEGLEDPDGAGGYRGWANRFAEHLARQFGTLEYANLAVRGLEAHRVRREQLGAALAMQPDVATVVAGVNDLLRPRFDADEVAAEVALMIDVLRTGGAEVLSFTMPDMTRVMPLARLLRGRLAALNERLRQTCERTGARLLDLAAHELGGDPRLWHHDRLHANALGHERIGMGLAHTLGLPGYEGWSAPLPELPPQTFPRAALAEATWAAQHFVPWVVRHARGGSSSAGRSPKRPNLGTLTLSE